MDPLVALAFADGPGPYTPGVLEVLERCGVTGTFFVIGGLVHGHERILQRALANGHAIGNHSFTHGDLTDGGYDEIQRTQDAIRAATGYCASVLRPPRGAASPQLVSQANSLGLHVVDSNVVDAWDWKLPGTAAIHDRVAGRAGPGTTVILHDGGEPRDQTVAALPRIVATFRSRGYRFVTVPELLARP